MKKIALTLIAVSALGLGACTKVNTGERRRQQRNVNAIRSDERHGEHRAWKRRTRPMNAADTATNAADAAAGAASKTAAATATNGPRSKLSRACFETGPRAGLARGPFLCLRSG